jgi:hypothetical protein
MGGFLGLLGSFGVDRWDNLFQLKARQSEDNIGRQPQGFP